MRPKELLLPSRAKTFCNCFLSSVGLNRDLHYPIGPHDEKAYHDYTMPAALSNIVLHDPLRLGADLYRCSVEPDAVFTLEDKDPSVLWRIEGNKMFDFWYKLFENSPDRWRICDFTNE